MMTAAEEKKYLQQEKEANVFACCLLMPEEAFKQQIAYCEAEKMYGDEMIKHMEKKFQVPLFAVVIRFQLLANAKI